MKLMRIALGQMLERKGMAVLMMLELAVTLVLFNLFAVRIGVYFSLTRTYETAGADRIWAAETLSLETPEAEELTAGAARVDCARSVTLLPQGEQYNLTNDNPTVYFLPPEYYRLFRLELGQGTPMTDAKEGCLNLIVPKGLAGRYRVGQSYSLPVWYKPDPTGEHVVTKQVEGYVCGVMRDSVIPTPGGGANYENTAILGLDLTGALNDAAADNGRSLFFFDVPPDAARAEGLRAFAKPLTDLLEARKKTVLDELKLPIVLSIALLCFSFSAFLGYHLLNLISREKRTAIYFLCGARVGAITRIQFLHDALLLGIPMLLAAAALALLRRFGIVAGISLSGFAVSCLGILLLFGVSSLIFLRQINQRSLVSYLHQWL